MGITKRVENRERKLGFRDLEWFEIDMVREKWKRREKKLVKKKTGMRVTGRSVFVLQDILKKKADKAKKNTTEKTTRLRKKKKES